MDLQAKIGPLPAYAWGGIIGLAIVGIAYWRSSQTAINSAAPAADGSAGSLIDGVDGAFGGFGNANGQTTPTTSGTGGIDSNGSWLTRAVAWLSGSGTTPLSAQTALSKYLMGSALTYDEGQIVNKALSQFGVPPDGVDTPTVGAKPTTYTSYLRDNTTGAIYGVTGDGSRVWLSAAQWQALGAPTNLLKSVTSLPQYVSYRWNPTTGTIYGVTASGQMIRLTPSQWAATGKTSKDLQVTHA